MKNIGKKAENLVLLESKGYNVPRFIILDESTIQILKAQGNDIQKVINKFFNLKYNSNPVGNLSIRSSGSVSAAGRMKTVLDVRNNKEDLKKAFEIVEKSTRDSKLLSYLKLKKIEDFKCSIVVQEMVYGNTSSNSCSGVLITTDPYDGGDYYAELVFGALGEGLMSGQIVPDKLSSLIAKNVKGYNILNQLVDKIKKDFTNTQEVEFVIQDEEVFILQIREYKSNFLSKCYNYIPNEKDFIGQGLAINNLSCIGEVTFNKENITENQIIVTEFTDFEDIPNMLKASGIITLKGGRLSHAAIIANEFDLACVVGVNFKNIPQEGQKIMFDKNGSIFNCV